MENQDSTDHRILLWIILTALDNNTQSHTKQHWLTEQTGINLLVYLNTTIKEGLQHDQHMFHCIIY